eukprot:7995717-Karenia_brevis.AAC.1
MTPKTSRAAAALQFRPLAIIDMFLKEQGMWFHVAVKPYLSRLLVDTFFGFIAGRSATEMILIRQLLMERSAEFNVPFFQCKFDIFKFFDSIRFRLVFQALTRRGVPE